MEKVDKLQQLNINKMDTLWKDSPQLKKSIKLKENRASLVNFDQADDSIKKSCNAN